MKKTEQLPFEIGRNILFHGSSNLFSKFDPDYPTTRDYLTDGPGVYLTKNLETAKAYGKYIYVVRYDRRRVLNFIKPVVIENYIKLFCSLLRQGKAVKPNVIPPNYFDELAQTAHYQHYTFIDIIDEMILMLCNDEKIVSSEDRYNHDLAVKIAESMKNRTSTTKIIRHKINNNPKNKPVIYFTRNADFLKIVGVYQNVSSPTGDYLKEVQL